MIRDLVASSAAVVLFALVAFVPGYVLGWAMNIFDFRRRAALTRIVMSVPLSIALTPSLVYLLGRAASMAAVWGMYASLWAGFLIIGWHEGRRGRSRWIPPVSRHVAAGMAIAIGWAALAIFSLIDVQIGDRLYFPATVYDYNTRTAVVGEISRTGLPPNNPFFHPGHYVPLRYHYFWYQLCSAVDRFGGSEIGPRHAIIAGSVWAGLGLICLIPLFLRLFGPPGPVDVRRRSVVGLALLAVTGLDLIPTLLLRLFRITHGDMEWWNEQITSWVGSVLWVPHHVAGLIACLIGFLAVWSAARQPGNLRQGLVAGLAAGLSFASAVGTSVYVTLVFGLFLAVWTAIAVVKRWRNDIVVLAAAGLWTCAFAAPYLLGVLSTQSSANPIEVTLRSFRLAETFVDLPRQRTLVNGLFLPLNYFLELGFFLVVGCLTIKRYLRRGRVLPRDELALTAMLLTSVLACTFLSSQPNNDLGWRGFQVAQFVLLIWGVDVVSEWSGASRVSFPPMSPPLRSLVTATLLLGLLGSVYSVLVQRLYPILLDAGVVAVAQWLSSDRQLGSRTYALRTAYEWLDRQRPADAIVQSNPENLWDLHHGSYANRQTVAFNRQCGVGFGGEEQLCEPIRRRLETIFSPGSGETGGNEIEPLAVCRSLSIDALVVKDTDPAWRHRQSWVWKERPLYANRYARVFACEAGPGGAGHLP